MRQLILFLIGIITLSFYSCDTAENNLGDLYAVWKLKRFECNEKTAYPDSIFFGFQILKGEHYYSYEPHWKRYIGTFEMKDQKLTLHNCKTSFNLIFLNRKEVTFDINVLTEDRLILSRNDSIWTFNKYLDKY